MLETVTGTGLSTTKSEAKFLRVNSLCDRWLTEQLQVQHNGGYSKQVSLSTVKRKLKTVDLTGQAGRRRRAQQPKTTIATSVS